MWSGLGWAKPPATVRRGGRAVPSAGGVLNARPGDAGQASPGLSSEAGPCGRLAPRPLLCAAPPWCAGPRQSPDFFPEGCTRAPRERRQWPATSLTPGALSRGLGSSHRCRLASGTALCRQAPVPRWPTQAPSASEVAPLRKTRKVCCISRWTFRHAAAAGPRVPARPFLPQRHGARTAVHFYRNVPRWDLCLEKGSRSAPGPRTGTRGGCLVIQEGVSQEPPGRTSLLSLQDSTTLRGPAEMLRFPERRL